MSRTFLIAPDSFKGSLTGKEVCDAIEKGIIKAIPDANIIKLPMADGGEGTVQSLVDATKGELKEVEVTGPLGETVTAKYGIMGDGKTAVIEMAEASGFSLVPNDKKNPTLTTTYGTGELIVSALDEGVDKIIIGIGGSATNDGGAGMAQALGVKLLDKDGSELPYGGGALINLASVDVSNVDSRLKDIEIVVASDVNNPLCGPEGASAVFGPQKGATEEMVEELDKALSNYAKVLQEQLGVDFADVPGAGAAGGLGYGLLVFTGARMQAGVDIVIEETNLEEAVRKADYVITGEGGIDFQTKYGKTPQGVSKVAKRNNKPVFVLAGTIGEDTEVLYDEGMTAIFGIIDKPTSLEEALANGANNLTRTAENLARVILALDK